MVVFKQCEGAGEVARGKGERREKEGEGKGHKWLDGYQPCKPAVVKLTGLVQILLPVS